MIKVSRPLGLILIVVLAILCYCTYAYVASARIVEDQNSRLTTSVDTLRPLFKNLEKTAFLTTFDSPDVSAPQTTSDLATTQYEIEAVRTALTKIEQENSSYEKAAWTEITPFYNKTDASLRDLHFMIAQTREVLKSYSDTISFLKVSNNLEQGLETQLTNVNTTNDFNEHLYQGARFVEGAAILRAANTQLKNTNAPNVYFPYRESILERSEQLASSLELLAFGLDSVSDVEIYSAVATIEELDKQYTEVDKVLRFNSGQKSPTLKEVSEITEKLDVFDGSRP